MVYNQQTKWRAGQQRSGVHRHLKSGTLNIDDSFLMFELWCCIASTCSRVNSQFSILHSQLIRPPARLFSFWLTSRLLKNLTISRKVRQGHKGNYRKWIALRALREHSLSFFCSLPEAPTHFILLTLPPRCGIFCQCRACTHSFHLAPPGGRKL
jgi:hypothetical protein